MSSLERGYGEWQMTKKFPVGTEVDVKDEDFVFSGIWCVTGISGSRHFERSYFLHLQEFRSGLSKTMPVDCRMWPTQIPIFKTFYSLYSYGIMHSRNPAKLNARINLHNFFCMWKFCKSRTSTECECDAYDVALNAKLCFVFVPQLVLRWEVLVEKDIWNGLPMM